jgi:hypothetical protein
MIYWRNFVVLLAILGGLWLFCLCLYLKNLEKPIPADERLLVACFGASLGWILISRRNFAAAIPLLFLSVVVSTWIGVVLKQVDWSGLVTLAMSAAMSALTICYVRVGVIRRCAIVSVFTTVWWCLVLADRSILKGMDKYVTIWVTVLGGLAATVIGWFMAIRDQSDGVAWRYMVFFTLVALFSIMSCLMSAYMPSFK